MSEQIMCCQCGEEQAKPLIGYCQTCGGTDLLPRNLYEARKAMNDALDRAALTGNADLVETMLLVDKAFRSLVDEIKTLGKANE